MRTLLTGEFATATAWDSDYYVKFEVQNGSGTWIDVGALLGSHWVVNASWSETVDQPVSQITVTLVPSVAGNSLSPLMSASPINVDDLGAYAPQLEMGRLYRLSVATMPKGVALDTGKYREVSIGRIDEVDEADDQSGQKPITVQCSDLGAWLMDIEIESTTDVQYGTDTAPGTALETVLQSIIDDNIPSGEPAVTLYKQSSSTFAVTPKYTQTQDKLLPPLVNIVLDTTGEDLRYRYDASHVSRLTWFNPDRSRSSVDATFDVNGYAVQKLARSLANIRNAGRIPSPQTIDTFVTNTTTSVTTDSQAKYRRRFMQLPASPQLTTDAQAQVVIDAAVNDLAGAPIEASYICPFLWFVQLYDRYTFPANGRQYDADQTLAVVGFTHTIESGHGQTVLSLTGRVVGAYAAWRKRVALGGPATVVDEADVSLVNFRVVSETATAVTYQWDGVGSLVRSVWAAYQDVALPVPSDPWSALALAVRPVTSGVMTFTVPKPVEEHAVLVQVEPRLADLSLGAVQRLIVNAQASQVPVIELDDLELTDTATQWWRITERGLGVTLVEAMTQVGNEAASAFGAPSRGPGDASAVHGGILGPGEYEQDVALAPTRFSWIIPRLTLSNGQQVVLGPFGFDRDKLPTIISVEADGTVLRIAGDTEVKSVRVQDTTSGWEYWQDGQALTVDATLTGTNGVAGMVTTDTDTFTVTVYNAAHSVVTGSTLSASKSLVVLGSAASVAAKWLHVTATTASAESFDAQLSLQASSAPGSSTVKVLATYAPDALSSTDITSTISPSLSGSLPPTSTTPYTYTVTNPPSGGRVGNFTFVAELYDGSGNLLDTQAARVTLFAPVPT